MTQRSSDKGWWPLSRDWEPNLATGIILALFPLVAFTSFGLYAVIALVPLAALLTVWWYVRSDF